jgi:hypothetical protein
MASIKAITVCMGIGLNQLFPEYTRIKIPQEPIKKSKIISSWLEEHGNPAFKVVDAHLEKTTKSKKNG